MITKRLRFFLVGLTLSTLATTFLLYTVITDSSSNFVDRLLNFGPGKKLRSGRINYPVFEDNRHILDKVAKLYDSNSHVNLSVTYRAHIFYYSWYANFEFDEQFAHWNHPYLSHWDPKVALKEKYPLRHFPPNDIGSNFYPKLGCYSSKDPQVLSQHFAWIRHAGIGVAVVSWYPPGLSDPNGIANFSDSTISPILDSAAKYGIKVTLHIEPYNGRSVSSIRQDLAYIVRTYAKHPAFYYYNKTGDVRPMIYVYDSYMISDTDWRRLLNRKGDISIRGSSIDCFIIGLLVNHDDLNSLTLSSFDGLYTYFATDRFSFGSSWRSWPMVSAFARSHNMIFIPSFGPGYIDTRIRPWNKKNARKRQGGSYFVRGFQAAQASGASMISITSFNEWGEGTQIEPAIPKQAFQFRYLDYSTKFSNSTDFYIHLTRKMIEQYPHLWG